jgi:hypothetical protein
MCTMASYAGLVVGAFGYVHEEYGRPPEQPVTAPVVLGAGPVEEAQRVAAS